jgi:ribulokinase
VPVLLSVDLGTEGARVGVFDLEGNCLADAHEAFPTAFPRPGWAEQDPHDWWRATVLATRAVLADSRVPDTRVLGIAVATTASTVAVLDSAGEPLRPALLWMDSRASVEAEETGTLSGRHPVLAYSGGADAVEWLVPKAMWLARHEAASYREAAHVAEAVDYLTWRLTGAWVGSRMNATCKWNYDPLTGQFPLELYADLGVADLAEKLPTDIRPVGEPAGTLSPAAAQELGIRGAPVVATGGIDAHVSLLGCGPQTSGLVSVVAGTSTVFVTEVVDAVHSPAIWGPYPHALRDEQWLIEGGQVSSGAVLNWLTRDVLGTSRADLGALTAAAREVAPGSHGLLVLDYFMGNRTPHRDARLRGSILGLTLGTTPAELYRAAVEGVCFGSRSVLESWVQAGIPLDRIVLSGGIRHNPLWLAATADVLGRPVEFVASANLTLRSGAVQSAYAAGLYPDLASAGEAFAPLTRRVDPDARHVEVYDEGFQRYVDATVGLRPHLHALTASTVAHRDGR